MELKDQVISQMQAVKLCELGLNLPSLFCFQKSIVDGENKLVQRWADGGYPAYTVAELGNMLKHWNNIHQSSQQPLPAYYDDTVVKWWDIPHPDYTKYGRYTTEAQCRAALLIALIENRELTLEQINHQ